MLIRDIEKNSQIRFLIAGTHQSKSAAIRPGRQGSFAGPCRQQISRRGPAARGNYSFNDG